MVKPVNYACHHLPPPVGQIYLQPLTIQNGIEILEIYRHCEDYLSLGPEPKASLEMVQHDIRTSVEQNGIYFGVYTTTQKLVGVGSYIPCGYRGDLALAFIDLLMIAAPYRRTGLGTEVVHRLEELLRQDQRVRAIRSAVQVNNPAGIRFWQQLDYLIDGEPEFQSDGTTTYQLVKLLE